MTEIIKADAAKEFDSFVASHPKGHFMQQSAWAKVKNNWIWRGIICRDSDGNIKGTMAVIIRRLPGGIPFSMLYAPRGPVCDLHDKAVFAELMDGAKQLAKEFGGYVLQVDTDTKVDDTEYEKIAVDYGFKVGERSKNFEGIQPRFVFRLDVKDKTEEELMEIFHSKTRYNIRLAMRKGVTVSIGTREDLKTFHDIMVITGTRDEFVVRTLEYFEKMYDCMAPENLRLYLAHYDGKIVAGTLAILYGNKVWYLYGASSNDYRNVMPNYLLQLEMIKWALENKCDVYDFRGISGDIDESNPLYGLYRFKKGFNGKFTEFVGEMDYVFSPFMYFMVEHGEKIYRELRKKLYLLKGQK